MAYMTWTGARQSRGIKRTENRATNFHVNRNMAVVSSAFASAKRRGRSDRFIPRLCDCIRRITVICLLACTPFVAHADYMPFDGAAVAPNIAEVLIAEDGVLVRLEVFPADVPVFEQLIPDAWYKQDKPPALTEQERLEAFSKTGLAMRRGDGRAIR